MKYLLDFSERLIGLDGQALLDGEMWKILANLFASHNSQEAIKWMDWAFKLWNDKKIEVDQSDLNKIKDLINSQSISNLVKAGLLAVIEKAKELKK